MLAALGVMLGAVSWSYFTNYWVPWLVVAGGQVPCALVWALLAAIIRPEAKAPAKTVVIPTAAIRQTQNVPNTPDYELFDPPFGEGAYGKVWLARNAIGQWQALKAIYLASFGPHAEPYEREFRGITRYKQLY